MNELQAIIDAAESAEGPLFLATVVDVVGSAYRRPGARMLVLPNGKNVGTISGGCLERDLCRQSAKICQEGPRLVSFDTRTDSANYNARYNLGCSGITYVLVEPVTGDDACPLRPLRTVLESKSPQPIGTVYETNGEPRHRVGERLSSNLIGIDETFCPVFDRVTQSHNPVCCEVETGTDCSVRVFVEWLAPPKPFWIFGAGDDAIPLAKIASELGWSVTVIDDRPTNLTQQRFPTADNLLLASAASVATRLAAAPDTAAILMTHSFAKDAALLPWLCESAASYVGVLGPKSRMGKLVRCLHSEGRLPPLDQLERLHTPVGLDIGAINPAQVAISIVAEVIATDNQRFGSSLTERTEPIHTPVAHEFFSLAADVEANR